MAKEKLVVKHDPPPAYAVPADALEVNRFIRDIGTHQRERERIEAQMNEELTRIRARYETEAREHSATLDALEAGLRAWCEAHRPELTDGGKTKTHAFAAGEICWKRRAPSVVIADAEKVLAELIKRRLKSFIRVKREINKTAMLSNPEAARKVPGVTIEAGENFIVTPFAVALEEPLSTIQAPVAG
jgi:phage host-nuclease inhibitor protein Gam